MPTLNVSILIFVSIISHAQNIQRVPEIFKKSKQKTREIKQINFFLREIAFLAVFHLFPVQKLISGHF